MDQQVRRILEIVFMSQLFHFNLHIAVSWQFHWTKHQTLHIDNFTNITNLYSFNLISHSDTIQFITNEEDKFTY